MSIQLKLDNIDFDQPKENHVKLQFIPASIEEATTANVEQYFNNYTTKADGCKFCLIVLHVVVNQLNRVYMQQID